MSRKICGSAAFLTRDYSTEDRSIVSLVYYSQVKFLL